MSDPNARALTRIERLLTAILEEVHYLNQAFDAGAADQHPPGPERDSYVQAAQQLRRSARRVSRLVAEGELTDDAT